MTRTGLTVLRPLLYYRESEIIAYGKSLGLKPLKNPCPYDGHTERQEMKTLIETLKKTDADIYNHLASAMRPGDAQELWPAKPHQDQMVKLFRAFWQKNK